VAPYLGIELQPHQRSIMAAPCHFAKTGAEKHRGDAMIKRDRLAFFTRVYRACVQDPGTIHARPFDRAFQEGRRNPMSTPARAGGKAGDAPRAGVVGGRIRCRSREAPGAVPVGNVRPRPDLDPANGFTVHVGKKSGRRPRVDSFVEQIPISLTQ